jgi:hypothetical protein
VNPRDEAAIANAMLLGELFVSRGIIGRATELYSFRVGTEDVLLETTKAHAAWMFLCRLGYGIEPYGTQLIKF